MTHTERVVILIDMDCFYCQVEEKLNPEYEGKPIAVVQYNEWRGGGIIAVNYPARQCGVTRHMRGEDAKHKCPDIILAKVPQIRGKADLTKYRDAGKRVADVLKTFTAILERASVDEAYLDVTDEVLNKMQNGIDDITADKLKNTHVVGYEMEDFVENLSNAEFTESNLKLCLGGIICEEIRAEVLKQTGYKCSAGIAHNKILAKLACGLHKPNRQTILPQDSVAAYFETVPIKKITGLGGKFGQEVLEVLEITKMGELVEFSEHQLIEKFGTKNGSWLYNIARGIDTEPVVSKLISKSIGCCKRFPGRSSLTTFAVIQHWMNELALEISERLQKDIKENNRKAKQMVISFSQELNNKVISSSRTISLKSYERSTIAQDGAEVIKRSCQKPNDSYNVTFLGISITNFQDLKKSSKDIASYFAKINADRPITNDIPIQLGELISDEKNPEQIKSDDENEDLEDDTNAAHSVYSASTEDLEEDPSTYIYFEDIYPEFVSSQPLDNYFGNDNEITSLVSQEWNKIELEKRMKSSQSFFEKYFSNSELETSDKNITEVNDPECVEATNSSNRVNKSETEVSPNEHYCPECKTYIPLEDFDSHSDYHVAVKIQAELNKQIASTSYKTPTTKVKQKKNYSNSNIKDFFRPA
ncbi:DNA polymerase eta [Diorhabda sublineata]|uniref:DNA polymerase eta n=1 Tax=Diorhabda sublineata TaxID=1163346 RepID=UPI0024E1483D|nr:DNA polymerase eta [Diorhabda sublineata]